MKILRIATLLAPLTLFSAAGAADEMERMLNAICAHPATPTQRVVCGDEELKRLYVETNRALDEAMAAIPADDARAREELKRSQERFGKLVRLCGESAACLKRIHTSRLQTLRGLAKK